MGVKPFASISILTAAALVSACSGRATVTVPPGSDRSVSSINAGLYAPPSARELAAEADARVRVNAKLAAGYMYQVTGTAHFMDVAIGKPATFTLVRGDQLYVKLVPKGGLKYVISGPRAGTRTGRSIPEGCAEDCETGNGNPTATPTPPPNYPGCSSSGGATWFNNFTGEGGCTSRGDTRPLSCGSWSWSSRGKGRLIVPGTADVSDIDYVIDNGDGSCRIGTI
jgi:hypothetical protein